VAAPSKFDDRRDGGHAEVRKSIMAKGDKGGKRDKDNGRKRKDGDKRDKKRDRYGNIYEKRKGTWTKRDKAEEEFGKGIMDAADTDRVNAELAVMNFSGKKGPPFKVAPTVVRFFMRLKEMFGGSYRLVAGIVKKVLEPLGIYCPTYSTARKLAEVYLGTEEGKRIMNEASELEDALSAEMLRFADLCVPHDIMDGDMMIAVTMPDTSGRRSRRTAVDGSGQTITSSGAWMRRKWGGGSGKFAKQHALVDVDSMEIIAFLISSDEVGDAKVLPLLLEAARRGGHNIGTVFADNSYDSFENWDAVTEFGADFVINLKKNAKKGLRSFERNAEIRIIEAVGYDVWSIFSGYGRRWMIEVFFSVFKKVFGDNVNAHTFTMISKYMGVKYELYMERNAILHRHLGMTA
jgi:hypothetical protein